MSSPVRLPREEERPLLHKTPNKRKSSEGLPPPRAIRNLGLPSPTIIRERGAKEARVRTKERARAKVRARKVETNHANPPKSPGRNFARII